MSSLPSVVVNMTPRKRKADPVSPAPPSDESPFKRARSESPADTIKKQNGNSHSPGGSPDDSIKHSLIVAKPSQKPRAARGKEIEAAPPTDLPRTWDQASAEDKILVKIKEENRKQAWSRIEERWERSTGEKPAKGMLPGRYKYLKGIMARSKAVIGGETESKVAKESLEHPDDTAKLPKTEVRPPSPVTSGSSNISSRAISPNLETAAKSSETTSAIPASEGSPEQELPQSWEQANPGDQLIVMMKTRRVAWAKIEGAWQNLTGQRPAKGALQDRYTLIKEFVIWPRTNGANTSTYPVKVGSFSEASDKPVPQRTKSVRKRPWRRKAEAETEESLDESSDESSDDASDESSYQGSDYPPKHSKNMIRQRPRGVSNEHARPITSDGRSERPVAKRAKVTIAEPSNEIAEAGSLDESEQISKSSLAVSKSANQPSTRSAQNTVETADEMLVEMKEKGYNWVEISQAWTERTGLTHAPETLRRRYPRIKDGTASRLRSITLASEESNAKATFLDEDVHESSRRRSKPIVRSSPIAETPLKRNMDRGKRRSSIKYTDSTTDEDQILAAPVEPAATAPTPVKRRAGRAAKIDRSDPEWLVTNEKSPLADEDLHAEFSDPKTYENFTKSDWEDLRETLPPSVPVNPDGYSIPMTFFKYDPDFRRGIREFQEDLGAGRLDPKWQADAAQAMEDRARGEFDAYKEDQFEAFWGQKQKMSHDILAGESTKIKLDLLIQNEVFKVGDYFSYLRVVGRGKTGVLIEKDCKVSQLRSSSSTIADCLKIVALDDGALTLAIPPGQRKYSRHMFESGTSANTKVKATAVMADGHDEPLTSMDGKPDTALLVADTEVNGGEVSETSGNHDGALTFEDIPNHGSQRGSSKAQDVEVALKDNIDEVNPAEVLNPKGTELERSGKLPKTEIREPTASEGMQSNGAFVQTDGRQSSTPALQKEQEDIILRISSLRELEHRIVDIDGRFKSQDLPTQNPWKNFRGIRNHQDLGSLFEMRDEFYVYKHPQIVKEPKRKR